LNLQENKFYFPFSFFISSKEGFYILDDLSYLNQNGII